MPILTALAPLCILLFSIKICSSPKDGSIDFRQTQSSSAKISELVSLKFTQSSISIPDFPIKVEFDKQNKKYIYSAHLVSRKPFKTVDDQKIASNIFDIFTCSVYKLYVFEHVVKNPEFMRDCFMQINYQTLTRADRYKLKEENKKWTDEFAPLIKQAQEEYDKKQKSNKKKMKS